MRDRLLEDWCVLRPRVREEYCRLEDSWELRLRDWCFDCLTSLGARLETLAMDRLQP